MYGWRSAIRCIHRKYEQVLPKRHKVVIYLGNMEGTWGAPRESPLELHKGGPTRAPTGKAR